MITRNRTRGEEGAPNPTDLHVGQQLRQRRTVLGLSQERLSEAVGITFQQIQKYERGLNRIGASRLYELSQALGVPVGFFFEGMAPAVPGMAEEGADYKAEAVLPRDAAELMQLFSSVSDPKLRRQILTIVKSLIESAQQN